MAECCGVVKSKKNSFFDSTKWRVSVLIGGIALTLLSYFWNGLIGGHDSTNPLMYLNPAWIVIFVCGWPLAYGGLYNLIKKGKVKTSLLITVAMIACIALEVLMWFGIAHEEGGHGHGNLFAAAEIALLMWLGELLEDLTVKRSRKGVEALVKLNPTMVRIKLGDQFVEMEAEYVNIDDIVLVKPNELIPVDGVVTEGITSVSQAVITGESVPIDKVVGDKVFAGTLNQNGAIEIRVSKVAEDTTLAKIIKLVKDAESKKAPIERLADRWSKIIVPSAITLSIVVFLVAFLILDTSWQIALTRGVTVLVVFCPCSLVLATPTAIAAGIGNASFEGILVKSGVALENLAKTEVVVFDKTGTLTQNKLSVKEWQCECEEETFFRMLGAVEQNSEHPLARAIVDFCKEKTVLPHAKDTCSKVGVGVTAQVDGKEVVAAKISSFKQISEKLLKRSDAMMQQGLTVVGLSIQGQCVGVVGISDIIKQDARSMVDSLSAMNINSVMLTGDNKLSASAVATELGIKDFRSDLLPEDKVAVVSELISQNKKVCMVGDGVNDAPSLATACSGVAMGALGSDAALEVADIVLMNDDIGKVGGIIKLGRRVLSTIKVNICIGMVVNFTAVILSAFGLLNPVLGALVHNCSSVFVVLNSALLLRAKKPFKTATKS